MSARSALPARLDPGVLRRRPPFAHYFRYPLRHRDFRPLRAGSRLCGYVAAKPLHGRLTSAGRVDRRAPYNGSIAVIFVPSPARSLRRAMLLFARLAPEQVRRPDGRRNWPAIRAAAEAAVREWLLHNRSRDDACRRALALHLGAHESSRGERSAQEPVAGGPRQSPRALQ